MIFKKFNYKIWVNLMLKDKNLNNFAYDNFREIWETETANKFDLSGYNARWMTLPVTTGDSLTGYFLEDKTGLDNVLDTLHASFQMFKENNFIRYSKI